jgi:hypothetical protein
MKRPDGSGDDDKGVVGLGSFVVSRKRLVIFLAAIVLLCGVPSARDAFADSAPAVTEKQLGALLSHLGDDRSSVREQGYEQLMKLHRSDLPTLRRAIARRPALAPDQRELVRGIVEQVYVAEIPYDGDTIGFLGVVFDGDQAAVTSASGGVEIRHRIPGFSASRYLEDGDIVLNITGPGYSLDLQTDQDFIQTVSKYHVNDTLIFKVLRRGKIRVLPIVLDAHPAVVKAADQIPEFIAPRLAEADGYWNETFAPLFDSGASAHAANR